jgi:hypothetical protein
MLGRRLDLDEFPHTGGLTLAPRRRSAQAPLEIARGYSLNEGSEKTLNPGLASV